MNKLRKLSLAILLISVSITIVMLGVYIYKYNKAFQVQVDVNSITSVKDTVDNQLYEAGKILQYVKYGMYTTLILLICNIPLQRGGDNI